MGTFIIWFIIGYTLVSLLKKKEPRPEDKINGWHAYFAGVFVMAIIVGIPVVGIHVYFDMFAEIPWVVLGVVILILGWTAKSMMKTELAKEEKDAG